MKLSIITINFNNASGLKQTLDSVAAQTYRNFEHIIVDGASTDGSVDVIRAYESSLASCLSPSGAPDKVRDFVGCSLASRLKWISEKDTGIYNAMNKGIKMATGEYLLFLNSGDYLIDDNVLENVFTNDCVADILCARCNVSDNGKVVWTSNPPENVTFGTLYMVGLAHQSTFIRKSLFEQYGYYDESFRYNADIEFWYRSIIEKGATTQRIDTITTDYNLDGISATKKNDPVFIEEHKRILSKPIFQGFLTDYVDYKKKIVVANEFEWIAEYKSLRWILRKIRKIIKLKS